MFLVCLIILSIIAAMYLSFLFGCIVTTVVSVYYIDGGTTECKTLLRWLHTYEEEADKVREWLQG